MKDKDIKKESKDGQINKLKKRIKKLEKENAKLKSEVNTLEAAYRQTGKFLRDHTDDIDLEDLIKAAKESSSLKQVQKTVKAVCPKCMSDEYAVVKTRFGKVCSCPRCNYKEVIRHG